MNLQMNCVNPMMLIEIQDMKNKNLGKIRDHPDLGFPIGSIRPDQHFEVDDCRRCLTDQ